MSTLVQPAPPASTPCPCGGPPTGRGRAPLYLDCCAPLHGGTPAPSAEALMRSRYSAYALGLADYLYATRHPRLRPAEPTDLSDDPRTWIGLSISCCETQSDTRATVRFVARYRLAGKVCRLAENSRFERLSEQAGPLRWFYVDGDVA